jgi:CheY-like chemotaxis protein
MKKKILVIDDEPDLTMLIKLNLELAGQYEVREQNSAVAAVQTAREFRPDLILLDVMMPDMDGGDVVAALSADADLKNIPVIFLTATVQREELNAPLAMIGGRPFMAKPVDMEALATGIENVLNQ